MNLAAPPPETEQSDTAALALSALVHLLLLSALFFGVQWKSQAPSAVEVEVWRSAPAVVAQPELVPEPPPEIAPEPKPVPKVEPVPTIKPDIAIKDDKKPKKEEPKKPEPKKEAPKKTEPDRRPSFDEELKHEQKQIQQQKTVQEQRAHAEAEAKQIAQLKSEQAAAARSRGLADYVSKVRGKIRGNIVLPPGIQGNPEGIFEVTQLPSGEVLSVRVRQSSGNSTLDAAIERAILKSSPLPKPEDSGLFDRELRIPYQPFDK
ncbi:energy transducer TonB [Propionivibrio sp.]|uniref:energy transducer TonB n=1 Tax=Propionivibrio sp. TaxID=2212460 RepID=UPI00262A2F74|nr:energy transducer TonB [Propionivibrio sp.]